MSTTLASVPPRGAASVASMHLPARARAPPPPPPRCMPTARTHCLPDTGLPAVLSARWMSSTAEARGADAARRAGATAQNIVGATGDTSQKKWAWQRSLLGAGQRSVGVCRVRGCRTALVGLQRWVPCRLSGCCTLREKRRLCKAQPGTAGSNSNGEDEGLQRAGSCRRHWAAADTEQ